MQKLPQERLCEIELSENQLSQVFNQIIATKNHRSTDLDTNYLLDVDLSILGKSWKLTENTTTYSTNNF
ncbi:hypothetical protein [Empedobacter tilapiae]|uniref:Uncharacterized protein n=1 Tax=Empedobacter tilapiae TaxID=2491114 RepID=A0A4Z1B5S5_9FLAO|nr:hypothetical protein [Empedobacter tilapiae]TGN22577.1 hypothetical protein E4J94_16170 [Empedobacter tilapiae]